MDVNGYDRFVISWEDVPDAEGNLQKFQLSIRVTYGACAEWHNNIYFTYESITKTCATTVGVEDQTGYQGTSIDYSQLSNNSCMQVYYSHGCKLDRLIIRLTKSDSDALIDFIPNYIVGYNVVLQDYSNPCGDLFVSAISYGVSLTPIIGTMYETLLIVTETAYVLSGNLSPGDPQVVNAGPSNTEAFINAPCFNEEGGWRPYDSTLATTVEWSFTDPNDKSHSMTITAEALYQDLYDGSYHTVPTSVTLNMYTGYHYVDIDTKIDGSETTGVKVWINDFVYYSPVSINLTEGNYEIEAESPIYGDSVEYRFQTWSDGIDDNPRTIGLYSDLNVSALYKLWYCLEILVPSGGGTTDPSPGTHEYLNGTILNVNAIPDEGFIFGVWNLDGHCWSQNPITVTMNSDHTLKAYFVNETGGGGGSEPCPTLFVWNGSAWIDYGVIDIHNPSGEDVIREVSVQTEDVGINNREATFRLREGWLGLNFSESVIDQVKLYAINEDGKLKLCPLTSAEHSRFGDVREYVASSDDVKVEMFLLETIDLTFKVPEDSQGFVFVIEGCNIIKL